MDFSIGYHMVIVVLTIILILVVLFVQTVLKLHSKIKYQYITKRKIVELVLNEEECRLILPYLGTQVASIKKTIGELENKPYNTIKEKRDIEKAIKKCEQDKEQYRELWNKLYSRIEYSRIEVDNHVCIGTLLRRDFYR